MTVNFICIGRQGAIWRNKRVDNHSGRSSVVDGSVDRTGRINLLKLV